MGTHLAIPCSSDHDCYKAYNYLTTDTTLMAKTCCLKITSIYKGTDSSSYINTGILYSLGYPS